MNPADPLTLVGGGSIVVGLIAVFTLLIRQLSDQHTNWREIVEQLKGDLSALRAECQKETSHLWGELNATREEHAITKGELNRARGDLETARLQIAELQRWEGEHRDP